MRIRKKSNIKLYTVLGLFSVVVICGVAYGILHVNNSNGTTKPVQEINYGAASQNQVKNGNDTKRETIDKDDQAKAGSDKSIEGQDGSLSASVSTTISDDTLYVRSEIVGLYAIGSCTLTIKKGEKTVSQTADLQALAQSTTCKGFNIPLSDFTSGTWNVTLDVEASGKTGQATTQVRI